MARLHFAHRLRDPDTYPADAPLRAPKLLETWLHYSPEAKPAPRDWEDWAENAAMLHAAHCATGNVRIVEQPRRIAFFKGDPTTYITQRPGGQLTYMYGIWYSADTWSFPDNINLVGNHLSSVTRAMSYGQTETFLSLAGRRFHAVDANHDQIEALLVDMHKAGIRDVFIKTRFKDVARRFTMPQEPEKIWTTITRDTELEWFLVQHEDRKNILYIQEAYEPTKEYRMIVVGDKPATGAGCIEKFTPVENNGDRFDDRMELIRNRSEPVSDPDTLHRYIEFATEFAQAWAVENGDDMIYSLDLSIDARTGNVAPIEVNPALNLGLYACNPAQLIESIQRHFG